ncbi:MAG: polysaccharide biosynthesis/export family protein [Verrucomicrobia bacterium]|nr:polysaccharide biosynthesis/export family protein [Verrucomicrobiota bacterium]
MNFNAIIFGSMASLLLAITGFAQTKIMPGRAITITISGVPAEEKTRIDGTYPVSESGNINIAHIGEVRAAGLRADELSKVLQSTYKSRQIYTNPIIQVLSSSMDTLDEQLVHIGGQVRRTGPTKFIKGLTLYQAIQAAGGPTEFGYMKRVKLFRNGKQRQYDLSKEQFMSVPLEPNDTIEVPQKGVFDW